MIPIPLGRSGALWIFKGFEIFLAWLALQSATVMATYGRWSPTLVVDEFSAAPVFTLLVLLFWHALLLTRGLYAPNLSKDLLNQLLSLAGCITAVVGIVMIVSLYWRPWLVTVEFVSAFWVLLTFLVFAERSLLRRLLRRLIEPNRNVRFALVVGSGERARRLANTLRIREELGYRVIGCVDDQPPPDGDSLPWLGTLGDLSKILSKKVVDEVFIALPMRSGYERTQQALLRCEEQGTLVTLPTDFFAPRLARTRLGAIDRQPVLYLSPAVPENDLRLSIKRAIDFFGALSVVMLLWPVMLAVAVAVRCTSNGPAIFKQTRIGLNKRPFTLYKFRTMVQDAEAQQASLEHCNEASGPVFKIRNDPRVTPLGSFLRRTSLDEVPQLFNVLNGDMSLVGPRPLPLRDVEAFREDWQRRRFSVRPGITCLWQLSGRSDISFEKWMELDLQYIDQWSLSLDIGILAKTVPAVLKRSGAY